jgi:anti-anti-sigma factor
MIIDIEQKNNYDIIHIEGEFNLSVLSQFEKSINPYLENPKHIIIDFEKIRIIDSSAIGLLLVFSNKFKKINKTISITNINDDIAGIFNIMNVQVKFKIYNNLEEAHQNLSKL